MTHPTLASLVLLVADDPDEVRLCVMCGGPATHVGLWVSASTALVSAVAWCTKPACIDDRDRSAQSAVWAPTNQLGQFVPDADLANRVGRLLADHPADANWHEDWDGNGRNRNGYDHVGCPTCRTAGPCDVRTALTTPRPLATTCRRLGVGHPGGSRGVCGHSHERHTDPILAPSCLDCSCHGWQQP